MEVSGFVEHETVAVTEDVGREPTCKAEATSTDDGSKTGLNECLTCLEVFTGDRHFGLFSEFPHCRDVDSCVRSTHDEGSAFSQCCVSVAHRRSDVLFVVGFHCCFESCKSAVNVHIYRNVDFGRSCPKHNDAFAIVFCFEVADVGTKLLNHIPTVFAVFYVVAVETLCVVVVERCLHRHDFYQLVLNGVDVFFFEYFSVDSRFVCVFGVNVP